MLTLQLVRIFRQFQAFFYLMLLFLSSARSFADSVPLTGVVVGPDRRPIANAQIDFVPSRAEFQLPQDLVPRASVRSDAQGVFPVPVSPTEDVVLIAYAPGFRRARFALVELPKAYSRIGISLERGEKITGTVFDARTGAPLGDAFIGPVVVSPDEDISLTKKHVPVWTTSTVSGRFVVDGLLPKCHFQFLVQKPGYQLANVSARAGDPNVIVRLERGGSSLRGVVRSPSQPPERFAHTRIWLNGNGFNHYTVTDAAGRFAFEGLPPGNFSCEALVEHPRVSKVALLEFPKDHGKEIELLVSEGYWLEGVTLDATTSAPVGGVVLRVEDRITTSAANGQFRVGPLWLVGKPAIEIAEECGYLKATPPVGGLLIENESDGFRNLTGETVWVRPIRRIRLELEGFGQTTQSLQAIFVPDEGSRFAERVTSSTHEMRLRSERGGIIWCTDQSAWATPYAVLGPRTNGKTAKLKLPLGAAASISGQVRREGESAPTSRTRVLVRLVPRTDQLSAAPVLMEALADARGHYRFPCVPPGDFRVIAAPEGGQLARSADVTVHAGQHAQIDISLPEGKRFSGIVRDTKQQALASVAVRYYVRQADGSTKAAMVETDAQGAFEVKELDGESLSLVRVERNGYIPWEKRDLALPCEGLEIVLTPETAMPFVVQGSPAETWQVYLMRIDVWGSGPYAKQLMGREVASTRVLGDSQDAFPAPPAGRYRIVAVGSAGATVGVSDEIEWDPARGLATPVAVVPGKTGRLQIQFENAYVQRGELVATNMILPESITTAERRVPNVEGDGVMVDDLVPGDYLVTASSSAFTASATNVRVEPDRVATVKLRALQPGAVEGTVKNGSVPLADVQVVLKSQTDSSFEPRVVATDSAGHFRIDGLPPDLYVVEVTGGDASSPRTLRKGAKVGSDGGVVVVDINVAPPPRLSFSLPASFNVSPGAPVILLSRESGELVKPQWNGSLLEAEVDPGIYTVSIGDSPVGTMRIDADGRTEPVE
jgi:hypothetical protein